MIVNNYVNTIHKVKYFKDNINCSLLVALINIGKITRFQVKGFVKVFFVVCFFVYLHLLSNRIGKCYFQLCFHRFFMLLISKNSLQTFFTLQQLSLLLYFYNNHVRYVFAIISNVS